MGCRPHVGNWISRFDLASGGRGERSLEERGQEAEADGGGCFFHALRTHLVSTHWVPHRGGAAFSKEDFLVTWAQHPPRAAAQLLSGAAARSDGSSSPASAPARWQPGGAPAAGPKGEGRRGDALTACRVAVRPSVARPPYGRPAGPAPHFMGSGRAGLPPRARILQLRHSSLV